MTQPLACKQIPVDHTLLYDLLVSTLTDFVIFLTDPQGCILSWNPGVEQILGFNESEWLGRPAAMIFTPEDRAANMPEIEISKAARNGQTADIRWHLRKDGSRLFVEGSMVALRDPFGQLLGFSKVLRDITARKLRELQLQDALAYSEMIVDTVREPLLVLDKDLRIRSANRSFYRTFEVSKEQTENQLLYTLGNGQWNVRSLQVLLEELLPKETTIENFEVEHDFPNLGRKIMRLNARKLWREGNHTELTLLAFEDITERRHAEEALVESGKQRQLIIDSAPAIIAYLDTDLRYRLANNAYDRWFGVSPKNLIGKTVADLFDQATMARLQPHLQKVLRGDSATFEEEYTSQKDSRTIQVTYTPDFDGNGEVRGFIVLGSDTTERKKADLLLRDSEERWRGLFERMTEGFFLGELLYGSNGEAIDFRFREVNPAFQKLTGLQNVVGKTVREVIPGIQEELIQTYARVVGTGEPEHFELFAPVLGGAWYEARARHTESHCFAVMFLSITERKLAEDQVHRNEVRQAALLALGDRLRDLDDVSSITSAAMEIVGVTLGVSRAGYGTVDPTQQFVVIDRDWTADGVRSLSGTYRFSDFGAELEGRLRRGESIIVNDVATDPLTAPESGRWKALNISAVINLPLVESRRLAAILFVQDSAPRTWTDQDLTFVHKVADRTWAAIERARALHELQESEEFTRSILASSPDCVKVLDLEGRLLTINEGGCRQMELDNFGALANKPWVDFWGDARSAAEQAIRQAKAGHTSRFEGFCPTARGNPKWWEVVVTPINDAAGKPVRILSLSRDITARQKAEEERERLTRELTRSNQDLSQFAHTVAHDLQSPLRGVTSFAQLLQRKTQGTLPSEEQSLVDTIVESGRRMQDLVQALLRFAQVGQGELKKEHVGLREAVDSAVQSLQVQIAEQGASVETGELLSVLADPIQLLQVLQNLIGNALKYRRPEVPPRIVITATKRGNETLISVEDNGQGIAPEYQAIIFEPLKRLHGTEVPGTGLGLSTCQRIITRHGGRIWVESQLGVGSTFFFTLPANPLGDIRGRMSTDSQTRIQ